PSFDEREFLHTRPGAGYAGAIFPLAVRFKMQYNRNRERRRGPYAFKFTRQEEYGMENNGTRGKRIQSVEKAMTLLDAVWRAQRPLALSELVAVTGWPKSTLHALLLSMEQNSVIEQELSTGKYRLGFHLFELGCVAESWRTVKEVAL